MSVILSNHVVMAQPASGFTSLWVESTSSPVKRLKSIDDAGTVVVYVGTNTVDSLTNKTINNQSLINNFSTTAQTPAAATRTYIAGSAIAVPVGKLQVGTVFRWSFNMTKTAAGTAASTFDIAFGTAGTTADTARVSFTKPAGTAVADEAWVTITAVVRGPLSASGVVSGEFILIHNLSATGHAVIPCVVVNTISGAFDVTVANLIVGICLTSGTADAITIQQINAESWNI
jgi:hypothetical protein